MDKFNTLLEAAQLAATRCGSWSFATSDDRYDVKGLLVLAETSDSENPIDEEPSAYARTERTSTGCF